MKNAGNCELVIGPNGYYYIPKLVHFTKSSATADMAVEKRIQERERGSTKRHFKQLSEHSVWSG